MTEERMEDICKALLTMGDEAKALCEMEPEDAAKRMTENGFSVTAEELVELSEEANKMKQMENGHGELNENELDSVAGGCWACVWDVLNTLWNIWNRHGQDKKRGKKK